MKVLDAPDHVVKVFDAEEKDFGFTITANAKSFKILADGIYKYKIKAIVRELGTNARDSHVMADKADLPFNVHAPTYNNPTFYIEDFGIGLSETQIHKVYTKFFKSDKDDSNECVGAFGLGAKTPFCYNTRSYTVESWHDGTHYIYNCFINEHGIPRCVKLLSEPTNRCNGVKVSFAVDTNDLYKFEQEIKEIYKHFEVKPKVLGKDCVIPELSFLYKGDKWGIVNDTKSYVIMGGIAYPMDSYELDDIFRKKAFILYKNIGEVDIDTSREGLSYTKKTIECINETVKVIADDLSKDVEKKIEESKTLYQARKMHNELYQEYGFVLGVATVKWDGIELKNNPIPVAYWLKEYNTTIQRYRRQHSVIKKEGYITEVGFEPIIINDLDRGGIARIKQYVHTLKNYTGAILVNIPILEDKTANEEAIADFVNAISADVSDVLFASKLPYDKPVVNRSSQSYTKLTDVMYFNIKATSAKTTWSNCSVQPTEGVYVVRKGYKLLSKSGELVDYDYLINKLNTLKRLDKILWNSILVYGIKESEVEDLGDDWVSVWDYIDDNTEKIKNQWHETATIRQLTKDELADINSSTKNSNFYNLIEYMDLDKEHEISKFIEKIKLKKDMVKLNTEVCDNTISMFGKMDGVTIDCTLLGDLKKLNNKYPLLSFIASNTYINPNETDVKNYITLVDGEKK